MFCKNCGTPMDNNAAVCTNCGFAAGTGSNFCANCGQPCKVPFEPRNDQPVFCSECFKNHRG